MIRLAAWKMTCGLLLLCAATAVASGQTFKKLAAFNGANGSYPIGSLIQGPDGNIYGTTDGGGAGGKGTVFRMTPEGRLTTIYSFCSQPNCRDGEAPGPLLLAANGDIYGITQNGGYISCRPPYGCGTVFKISPKGEFTTLHFFGGADGAEPDGGLIQGVDGNFYGTATSGGDVTCNSPDGCGTVFRISAFGALTTLHVFENKDGSTPESALLQASNGDFYGTTTYGGDLQYCYDGGFLGCGTIFKITAAGILTKLFALTEGLDRYPDSPLIQASDGNLYGTTQYGTVFKIELGGSVGIVYQFPRSGDSTVFPEGFTQGTDGNLYGPTFSGGDYTCNPPSGCGSIYQLTLGGALTTLHDFELTDGAGPGGSMLQSTTGLFYGATGYGGRKAGPCKAVGCGVLYTLDMGLGPFVAFVGSNGKVGQTVGVLGQGFIGTTSVALNGTPATFTVVSDTSIRATVPAGAITGYVTVTTPSGTLTSNVPFNVIP